ncbi:MAG: ubiquinol-cytochrome c reductase iron-sulfur subunit [Candidatus Acidiferrales bacterium]
MTPESSPAPGSTPQVSRRGFAKYLTLGGIAAAVGGLFAAREYFHSRGKGARVIAQAADIAVTDSLIFQYPTPDAPFLLIRTGENSYAAYSRSCTHNGCPVYYRPENRDIECPCHGGVFSLADGSVLAGPPPRPLPRILIEVRGPDIIATGIAKA